MAKKLTQAYIRKYVHRHNSFQGSVAMAKMNMRNIRYAETTTPRARSLAMQIEDLLIELKAALRTRVDPE